MADLSEIEEHLTAETLAELRAAKLVPGRPVIAVDADDTLVHFVGHLSRWMQGRGFRMKLESYQLEGSMFAIGSDDPLPFEDCIQLINDFFAAETRDQQALSGAVGALNRLCEVAQVIVLTNVPRHAAAARRENLVGLGLDYPVVINSGGKGRAMAWIARKAHAPTALIDDSSSQLESVAKHAPDAWRLHFAGTDHIARLYPTCAHAHRQVHDWAACEVALRDLMDLSD